MSRKLLLALALALVTGVQCRPGRVDEALNKRAFEYYAQLHEGHPCQLPQARVIRVQDVHPDNQLTYTTGSVLLHRCAGDTGCCHEKDDCVAEHAESVALPILAAKTSNIDDWQARLMTFINHTRCHCVQRHEDETGSNSV